jgi:predicted small integral membrane protein
MLASWTIWQTARLVVAVLVLIAASYYLVVAFDNITNPTGPASNWPFVRGVMSMEGVPEDDGFAWRAIESEPVHAVFYVAIMLGEAVSGLLLLWGGIAGLRATDSAAAWSASQRASLLGCSVGLLVFWFGFIVVGGNWWIMFLNPQWNGIEPAFQNATLTLGTVLAILLVAAAGETRDERRES